MNSESDVIDTTNTGWRDTFPNLLLVTTVIVICNIRLRSYLSLPWLKETNKKQQKALNMHQVPSLNADPKTTIISYMLSTL